MMVVIVKMIVCFLEGSQCGACPRAGTFWQVHRRPNDLEIFAINDRLGGEHQRRYKSFNTGLSTQCTTLCLLCESKFLSMRLFFVLVHLYYVCVFVCLQVPHSLLLCLSPVFVCAQFRSKECKAMFKHCKYLCFVPFASLPKVLNATMLDLSFWLFWGGAVALWGANGDGGHSSFKVVWML